MFAARPSWPIVRTLPPLELRAGETPRRSHRLQGLGGRAVTDDVEVAGRNHGLRLYYLNGAGPKEFFHGDANLDGFVNVFDLALLAVGGLGLMRKPRR